jgi:hypothetical protein
METNVDQKEIPAHGLQLSIPEAIETQSVFSDAKTFEHGQRVAKMLCSSSLVPKEYQGNMQNTLIALEMANRIGASPLMVMQNLYVIQGKPSWSSSFIIAALNSCKRFSPLRFEMDGKEDEYGCRAWAYELSSKDKLEGPKITYKMAKEEGWFNKAGSKWKTMPELMLRYRAAAFFGRLYAPDVLMGMHSMEEVQDFSSQQIREENDELKEAVGMLENAKTEEDFQIVRDSFPSLINSTEFEKNFLYYHRKNIK